MTPRRRAVLLGGLALLLGALAASDVARREQALREQLAPLVDVVVVRRAVEPGRVIRASDLAVRRLPVLFAPAGRFARPEGVVGLRAAVALAPGIDLVAALVGDGSDERRAGPPVRPGERIAELVARGSAELVQAGARVDVLVTRDAPGGGDGRTEIALQDAEVLAAAPAASEASEGPAADRVAVSLRVTLRQAVDLAAAEQYAREVRVLPRATGDRGRAR